MPILGLPNALPSARTMAPELGENTGIVSSISWLQVRDELGYDPSFNASQVLDGRQSYEIQMIAVTFSSLSCFASLIAVYWFWLMRRNFRRDLILLLIMGDFWKSSQYLIFSSTALAHLRIGTHTRYCQAAGFLLQSGIVSCDVAIFLISLHLSLQLFPPKRLGLGQDGLYRVRRWVYAAWIAYPTFTAALAFVNRGPAYNFQGGFCTLPIRPFWYRLSLSWIPRYMITIYVLSVAIRIYRLVGYEFKVYGKDSGHSRGSQRTTSGSAVQRLDSVDAPAFENQVGCQGPDSPPDDNIAPDDNRASLHRTSTASSLTLSQRLSSTVDARTATPAWPATFGGRGSMVTDTLGLDLPDAVERRISRSRAGSRVFLAATGVSEEDFAPAPSVMPLPRRPTLATMRSSRSIVSHHSQDRDAATGALSTPRQSSVTSSPAEIARRDGRKRRRAMQRQLRLLFVYPITYLIMWVLPFVAHAMLYNYKFAQHPLFGISALNIFCLCFMGTVDVCIFSWREKPWKHIPGSSGTFIDSFIFWRYRMERVRMVSREDSGLSVASTAESTYPPNASPASALPQSCLQRWLTRARTVVKALTIGRVARGSDGSVHSRVSASDAPSAPRPRYGYSGRSDRRVAAADQARERLAMERAAATQQGQRARFKRSANVMATVPESNEGHVSDESSRPSSGSNPPGRREWWESMPDEDRDDDLNEELEEEEKEAEALMTGKRDFAVREKNKEEV